MRMASTAAYWLVVGADMMPNWCSFSICWITGSGPHT